MILVMSTRILSHRDVTGASVSKFSQAIIHTSLRMQRSRRTSPWGGPIWECLFGMVMITMATKSPE